MAIQQMLLGLGGEVIISASDGDTNINLSTVFGSNYTSAVPKRYKVASGIEIGASFGNNVITIPSGMAGTLTLDIDGTVTGAGGTADNNGGDAIYIASSGVTIDNSGTIRAGGGAGGDGGAGGTGGNGTVTSYGGATGTSVGNCSVAWAQSIGQWLYPPSGNSSYSRTGDQLCAHCHGSQYVAVSQGSSSLTFGGGSSPGTAYDWGRAHPTTRVWNNNGYWTFLGQGCREVTTSATSGGSGGSGGAGGVGQGYNQSATNGSSGASGSAGGTNAGTGGAGGTGGNGGAYGANGTNGATGSSGANGNSTNGSSGSSGVNGHLAGYYLKHASSISSTMNNTGTLTGSLG